MTDQRKGFSPRRERPKRYRRRLFVIAKGTNLRLDEPPNGAATVGAARGQPITIRAIRQAGDGDAMGRPPCLLFAAGRFVKVNRLIDITDGDLLAVRAKGDGGDNRAVAHDFSSGLGIDAPDLDGLIGVPETNDRQPRQKSIAVTAAAWPAKLRSTLPVPRPRA